MCNQLLFEQASQPRQPKSILKTARSTKTSASTDPILTMICNQIFKSCGSSLDHRKSEICTNSIEPGFVALKIQKSAYQGRCRTGSYLEFLFRANC